jgi:uncharacterized lipoprotein YmbA
MEKLFFGIVAITLSSCAVTKESKEFVRILKQEPTKVEIHSTENQPIEKEIIHPLLKDALEEEDFIRILQQNNDN